jgi:two-component system, cell cycle sensor histidine kinase and response regulator CckA
MSDHLHTSIPTPVPLDQFLSSVLHNSADAITEIENKGYNTLAAIAGLYDAIPASIIIVDVRMRIVGWNRFSRDTINGLRDSEMLGVNPLKRVHPDDFAEISRKVHDIIHFDTEQSAEFRMLHKSEPPYKWAMFRGKRVIFGNEPCVVAVVTEITELKETEQQQKKLQEQLLQYQKMELVGQLAGGVAHDFNNALAAILGNTELALRKLDPSSPVADNISDIHKLALRSAEMTRQLLAFARKQVATPEVFELNEAVSEFLRLHRSTIGDSIQLEWHPHAEPVQVKLDPMQLDQILSNLLLNARDAITGNGTIEIKCEAIRFDSDDSNNGMSGFAPGAYVKLTLSDTGSGIEPEILPHIYEPFFTTKAVGKGTGLGLSTVYGIVMQNRGHIECQSEIGKGAIFTVYLPLHHEEVHANDEAKETILVVDDEPSIIKLIQDILESRDFTVLAANNAGECLQIADGCPKPVDLLVADALLPDMSSMEMFRLLKQRNPSMKHLFMSAHTPEQITRSWTQKDGMNFIQKPFGIGNFIEAIELALNSCAEQR